MLYLLPDPQSYSADYVAFDLSDAIPANQQADQQMFDEMLGSTSYRIIGIVGKVVLLQHLNLSPLVLFPPGHATGQIRDDTRMVIPHLKANRPKL
jgi:hypothetical protein